MGWLGGTTSCEQKRRNLFFFGRGGGGAGKESKGRKEERTDTVNVDLSEVTCLCGFLGTGAAKRGTCGAGIMISGVH